MNRDTPARQNFMFMEVPTATITTKDRSRLLPPRIAFKEQKQYPKPNDMGNFARHIQTTYNKIISNFNQSIQPLPDHTLKPFKVGNPNSSTPKPKLRSLSQRSIKIAEPTHNISVSKLPRIGSDTRISASFTVHKTKMHAADEKKRSSRVQSDYQTPLTGSAFKMDFKDERMRSEPKERYQQPPTTDRQQLKISHIKIEAQTMIESEPKLDRTDRKVIIEELSGRLLQSFLLEVNFGKVDTRSPSFQHFQKTKSLQWEPIENTLKNLERFGTRFSIPHFEVRYNELMRLCKFKKPSNCSILRSLVNWERIAQKYNIIGRQYLEADAQDRAATRIQSFWRMTRARVRYVKMRILVQRVKIIQRAWKRKYCQIVAQKKIYDNGLKRLKTFQILSQNFRQQWPVIKTKHRVQVHLHNISLDEMSKLTVSQIQQKQNTMLSRIFRSSGQFLVDIVYISPYQLPEEVKSYYYKMLELGSISRERIQFVSPENSSKFPLTLSTSKLLLYSPKCQNRIKRLIGNRPAYIISGQPSTDDIHLSVELNLPLFSGSPCKHRYYSTKAGSRSIFRKLHMPLLKGGFDIYNFEQLINTLAILIYTNPTIPRWYLKIDDEVQGRGIAIINVGSFSAIKTFAKALGKRSIIETEFTQTEVIKAIAEELTAGIYLKLKVCEPRVYSDARSYLTTYLVKGGSIESCIETPTPLSINFLLEPTGEHTILSTYEKITQNNRVIGCMCPPQTPVEVNCQHIVKSIKRLIWDEEQMYGYFTIDLLVSKGKDADADQTIYFVGLDCYLNTFSSAVFLAQFVSNSKYDISANILQQMKKTKEADFGKLETLSNYSMVSAPQPPPSALPPVFLFFPFISHNPLKSSNFKAFFQTMRFGNVSFDIAQRQGVVFQMYDGLASGVLGLVATANGLKNTLKFASDALDLLAKQFVNLERCTEDRTDKLELAIVKSKVMILAKREKKTNKDASMQPQNISFLF